MGRGRGANSAGGRGGSRARQQAQQRNQRNQKNQKNQRSRRGPLQFAKAVRTELKKVSWPDRDQLRQSTAVVLVIVATLGVYVAFWDYIFQNLARLIFS